MEKNRTKGCVLLAVLSAFWLAVSLAVPFPKTGAFWVSFAFGLIAVAAQVFVTRVALKKGKDARSLFFGFPIARVGAVYLALQWAASFAVMALGFAFAVPAWVAVVLGALLFSAFAFGLTAADAARDEVTRQEARTETDVRAMRGMQGQAAEIVSLCGNAETKKRLAALAERFRYSDPVSSGATREAEAALADALDDLQVAVEMGKSETVMPRIDKIEAALAERNRLCRLNK